MVNRYNQEKKRKSGQKKFVESFPNLSLSPPLSGTWFQVEGWQGRGRGFRREGVGVRDGAMVGWIEETQTKTKGWVSKEVQDEHDVLFLSQTALPLLCICAATCLCLQRVFLKQSVFFYCAKKEQTPASSYITISKNLAKIWCKTAEPKKSYGGLKLMRLDLAGKTGTWTVCTHKQT